MAELELSWHELGGLDRPEYERLLQREQEDLSEKIEMVRPLIDAVEREGDAALARYALELDGATLAAESILASEEEFERAGERLDSGLLETLELAANNIRSYHEPQLPIDGGMRELAPGIRAGERILPVASAGCYTPRGKGSFPSVTLMTVTPAVVAGVREVVVLTPPGPDGTVDDATLVAARLAGASKVAKAGGAMAVAAAAFGTESVPRCRKFEGPGSSWLLAAKQLLSGRIDSRLPAGPSESIIYADSRAPARKVALDLLIESEHGEDSSVFLVTCDRDFASEVCGLIPGFWEMMEGRCADASKAVLTGSHGGIVIAEDEDSARDFINDYAPEHLQIMTKDPHAELGHIQTAAEVLLGEHTAGSIANYMIGPNCVLPTSGAGHSHSPLGVYDFMRRQTVAELDSEGYASLAPHTRRFASYEGFSGHANAVSALRDGGV